MQEVEEADASERRRAGQVRELRGGWLAERSDQCRPCRSHLRCVGRRDRAGALISVGELRNHPGRRPAGFRYYEVDVPIFLQLHLNDLRRQGEHG